MKKNNSDRSGKSEPVRLALNLRQTAGAIGVSEMSVRRLVKRKLLKPSRALRTLVFPVREVERFLAETM